MAAAAPARPAVVGTAQIADPLVLTRMGVELRGEVAPRAVSTRKLGRTVAEDPPARYSTGPYTLRDLPGGDVLLAGKYGWVSRGPDLTRLGRPTFREDLTGRFAPRSWQFTADGGVVAELGLSDGRLIGLGPDLQSRWSTVSQAPFAVAAGGRVYALGGRASVLDALTGQVTAAIDAADAGDTFDSVTAAPDGSARVVAVARRATGPQLAQRISVQRVGADGRRLWSTVVAGDPGPLGVEATTVSVGSDGSSYVGVGTTNGISRWNGRLVALAPDGQVRWTVAVPGMPSRPAIDTAGNVWAVTNEGFAVTAGPAGELTFQRRLGPRNRQGGTVAAHREGVLAMLGGTTVRLVARPAPTGRPAARVALRPTVGVQQQPFRCVAPPSGRPKTCLYRIAAALPLRIVSPGDGTADIETRPVTPILLTVPGPRPRTVPLAAARDAVPVVAGDNRVQLNGLHSLLSLCPAGRPCTVRPGPYRVRITLRAGGAPLTFTRSLRVEATTGRWVD